MPAPHRLDGARPAGARDRAAHNGAVALCLVPGHRLERQGAHQGAAVPGRRGQGEVARPEGRLQGAPVHGESVMPREVILYTTPF